LSISYRPEFYTNDNTVWGEKPYDLAALAAWNLGLKDKAVEYGEQAVALSPDDARLKDNLEWYKGNKS